MSSNLYQALLSTLVLFACPQSEAFAQAPTPQKQVIEPEMVTVGNFSMGKYEVTVHQWQAVMADDPTIASQIKTCGLDCPVVFINWADIQTYLSKLNQMTGKHYRLPTVAEWDQACGSGMEFCGSNDLNSVAWYADNATKTTHPVGQKQANAKGIYDMSGNAGEVTSECFIFSRSGIDNSNICTAYFSLGGTISNEARELHTTPQGGGPGALPANRGMFTLLLPKGTNFNGFRLAHD